MGRKVTRMLSWNPVRDGLRASTRPEPTVVMSVRDDQEPDRRTELALSANDAEFLGNKLVSFAKIARGE